MSVVFVDLVDSTAWSAQQTGEDHARAVALFEQRASHLALSHGGRVVKFIGDAAMIVAPEPATAVAIAVELTAAVAEEPSLPLARASVWHGAVTARAGDYFGDLVNLVARATKSSAAGAVVVTSDVVNFLDPALWRLTPLGSLSFRGVPEPIEIFRVGKAGPASA